MAINTVGIVGAGTMGNGIAQVCAAAGLTVVMVDISADARAGGASAATRDGRREHIQE
ncbi:3-hydroxybutyryl-CoA dehydrogenase [Azoarcus sp. Aa7]|nr:3-hydroxybutyryl-CoA dehydrogenase [Azoarcus sp. Aa7]